MSVDSVYKTRIDEYYEMENATPPQPSTNSGETQMNKLIRAIKDQKFETASAMLEHGLKWNNEIWDALMQAEPCPVESPEKFNRFTMLLSVIKDQMRAKTGKVAAALQSGAFSMAIALVERGCPKPGNYDELMIDAEAVYNKQEIENRMFGDFDSFQKAMGGAFEKYKREAANEAYLKERAKKRAEKKKQTSSEPKTTTSKSTKNTAKSNGKKTKTTAVASSATNTSASSSPKSNKRKRSEDDKAQHDSSEEDTVGNNDSDESEDEYEDDNNVSVLDLKKTDKMSSPSSRKSVAANGRGKMRRLTSTNHISPSLENSIAVA